MQLGWIDFSKTDRDKVLDILDLLGEKGTLDELGIASIRDAYSNLFFPGTSTIQTRAKYFFIIPYIFKDLELKKKADCMQLKKEFKKSEKDCALILSDKNPKETGIIGKRVLPNGWVQRTPSSIYWSGLQKYGIIDYEGSIDELIEDICSYTTGNKKNYSINVPGYCENWQEELDIHLTLEEGQFLKEQIISTCGDTLFAYLLENETSWEILLKCNELKDLKYVIDISDSIRKDYDNAIAFSDFIFVLTVIYNVHVLKIQNDKAIEYLNNSDLKEISKIDVSDIMDSMRLYDNDIKEFMTNAQQLMEKEDIPELIVLIEEHEKDLKGNKAKSRHSGEFESDDWFGRKLDYRFFNALKIIKDIDDSKNV